MEEHGQEHWSQQCFLASSVLYWTQAEIIGEIESLFPSQTEVICSPTEIKCANNLTCISRDKKCNGARDCADESDEKNCREYLR